MKTETVIKSRLDKMMRFLISKRTRSCERCPANKKCPNDKVDYGPTVSPYLDHLCRRFLRRWVRGDK